MAAINTVTLIGRVVRDIEVNSTNSGKSVASFALAVDGYGKDADAILSIAWLGIRQLNCWQSTHRKASKLA